MLTPKRVDSIKILWLIVLAAAALTHASYVNNGFTWLDHGDIGQKRAVLPVADLGKAFTQPFGETGFYRPLVTILHSIDAALYADWAPGFHFTNILLFVLTVAAVALFVPAFFGLSQKSGLLAAFVFAIHPLSWLPAGSISYRSELLVVALTCMTVFFYIRMRQTAKWSFLAGFFGCFLGALLSKETPTFWMPALLIAFEIFHFNSKKSMPLTSGKTDRRMLIAAVFGAALLLAGYIALRMAVVPDLWHTEAPDLTLQQAFFTRLHVLGMRLLENFSPLTPSLSDATQVRDGFTLLGAGALLAVTGGTMLTLRAKKDALPARVVIFLAIALAPALNLIALPRFSSPHYGFFAAVAAGVIFTRIVNLSAELPALWQNMVRSAAVVWCAIAAVMTFMHGGRFGDDRALFASEVAADPDFLEGHFYLGEDFFRSGDALQAAASYRAALNGEPRVIAYVDRASAMINLAGVELKLGNAQEAEKLLTEVSGNVSASEQRLVDYNLALLANQRRDYARVVALLEKHIAAWQRAEPLMMQARALRYLDRTPEAMQVLARALPFLDTDQQQKVKALIENAK